MPPVPVYSIVGYSGTGKTTFLEKLVPELKGRGLRLAVIKHDAHRFEMDKEGKDSWRFTRAGADVVAVLSEEKSAFLEQRTISLSEALERIHDVDLILTEGYKHGDYPKIAVYRAAAGTPLAGAPEELFAIVTDTPFTTNTPCFALDDAAGVAALICGGLRKE